MGLADDLKKRALGASQKAVEQLLADPSRAERIGRVVGQVQRGKAAVDKGQEQLLKALGFATQGDFKAVGKQLAGLKRRARLLGERLASLE
jgi:hypothetical protein